MGYFAKAGIGIALMLGALGLFVWDLLELIDIGTCASGGPYESVRECPAGTGGKIGLMFVAVLSFIAGVGLFAIRGSRATKPGLPSAATEAGPDWGSFGNMQRPSSPAPAAPAPPTVFANRERANASAAPAAAAPAAAAPPPAPAPPATASPPAAAAPPATASLPAAASPPDGDPVERLERLNELRAKGAISEAEFASAKARILQDL